MKAGQNSLSKGGAGFTLVEVVIAVGLTAATVLTVFALLVPARDGSREAALAAAAVRLQPALEADLQERGMERLFSDVAGGGEALYAVYQVRIKPEVLNSAITSTDLQPSSQGNLGDGFTVTTVVRDLSEPGEVSQVEDEMSAVGEVTFVVRLGVEIGEDVQSEPGGSFADFPAAVLVLNAEFIEVPSSVAVSDWAEVANRRRPVLTVPVTVRR